MTAVTNYIIYLAVPNNCFEEDLFHNLPRNRDETVLCTVLWISFLSLLKVGILISFLQLLKISHNHHNL